MKERSALIVLDMQNGLISGVAASAALVCNVNTLIDAFHDKGLPVCFVRHTDRAGLKEDTHNWQIIDSLHKQAGDTVLNKHQGSAFKEQDMQSFIREEGICIVTVAGLMTQACVQKSCREAIKMGLGTVLIADAHSNDTRNPQAVNNRWNEKLMRKGAAVITTEAFLTELSVKQ